MIAPDGNIDSILSLILAISSFILSNASLTHEKSTVTPFIKLNILPSNVLHAEFVFTIMF